MSSLYSIGQMNEHADALERNGWTPADLKKASGGDILAHLLPLVRAYGEVAVATVPNLINCDADPFVPDGWTVESHKKGGQFAFDPAKIKFYLSQNQQGKCINGTKLYKELANEPVLNANVLDYLLKNPRLIPEEWKRDAVGNAPRLIFFWGTIYRDRKGNVSVRFLHFDKSWDWYYRWLIFSWYFNCPAATS